MLCVVGLWQAVKCVWTSEQSSTYSTPLQLCANERCVCVYARACVCDCSKGLSHWLTLPYAWNNSYTRQVAVAPRSPELRCHLRNTVWFCCSLHAADCQPIALPTVEKTKPPKSTHTCWGRYWPWIWPTIALQLQPHSANFTFTLHGFCFCFWLNGSWKLCLAQTRQGQMFQDVLHSKLRFALSVQGSKLVAFCSHASHLSKLLLIAAYRVKKRTKKQKQTSVHKGAWIQFASNFILFCAHVRVFITTQPQSCLENQLKTIRGKASSIPQFSPGLTDSVWLPGFSI